MSTSHYDYPRFGQTIEDAWDDLTSSVENMRNKLGAARIDQLLDMCRQAQRHFLAGYRISPEGKPGIGQPGFEDIKLGTRLMQDIEWVVRGREPFAYPKELYRWPAILGSRPAGDPDLETELRES